jgi:hypothetical protein
LKAHGGIILQLEVNKMGLEGYICIFKKIFFLKIAPAVHGIKLAWPY